MRPRLCRRVMIEPEVVFFKPAGVRMSELEESVLTVDEFEAVRLKDLLGLDQELAAKRMNISQPTFHRLVVSARKKLADAIVNGKAIKIYGGNFKMVGRGRMKGRALGPGGNCICPSCGHIVSHQTGMPCIKMKCPKCNVSLTRE
ncbi:DUF134 domain-containing protein [Candidatus Woesearchaeota archaeon]|nr:DUF134 domain-containing protein [Candidatus Woesearchaeota archaeon]